MAAATQFDLVFKGLSTEVGSTDVIASSGMTWKGVETNEINTVGAQNIKRAAFSYPSVLKTDNETFDGFKQEIRARRVSAELFKNNFHITVEEIDVSFKEWVSQTFEVMTLSSVKWALKSPSNIAGRTEVSLEFSTGSSPSKSKHAGDEMTEIWFHVPGCDAEGDDDELTAAQAFHDSIKEIADIGQVTGDIILSFEEVHVLTPRGRHDVDMFPDFLRSWGGGDYCGAEHAREEIAKHERLKKSYEDPTSEVIPSISRPLSKRRSSNRALFKAVTANLKAVQSDLFIEKYIFVSEQPSTAARTFNLEIVTNSEPEHMFISINREELDPMERDDDYDMQSVDSDEDKRSRIKSAKGDDEDSSEDAVAAQLRCGWGPGGTTSSSHVSLGASACTDERGFSTVVSSSADIPREWGTPQGMCARKAGLR
ncbi:structure-specific recognition protein-domain-containing protein [Mycena vulgaris]|nr:structure-specific recognition protein-domain-containing protein [Mycena vulgaris]